MFFTIEASYSIKMLYFVFFNNSWIIKTGCLYFKSIYLSILLNFFANYFRNSKLNSNPYHYKLKFISTSKKQYNSKFQEFKTVRNLKIQKNDQIWSKKFLKINDHEKARNKEKRKKGNFPKPLHSFSFLRPLLFFSFLLAISVLITTFFLHSHHMRRYWFMWKITFGIFVFVE